MVGEAPCRLVTPLDFLGPSDKLKGRQNGPSPAISTLWNAVGRFLGRLATPSTGIPDSRGPHLAALCKGPRHLRHSGTLPRLNHYG